MEDVSVAKKLKRVRVGASPVSLFIQLLVPWLVIALAYLLADAAGLTQMWAVIVAIAAGLYATFMVGRIARLLRARKAAALHGIEFDVRQLKGGR